jgi:hypothetical protein
MLKSLSGRPDVPQVCVPIGSAPFPVPFASGLEYVPPARGVWNIVHVGMLIPEAHQIFVCAPGCLRGVVLTAAEMNASDRFSTVAIRESDVLEGGMESLIIEGVTDILNRLPSRPPAVLVFTSCIQHFMGCDLPLVYRTLRARFPGTAFADCYMTPILRKSGLTPDEMMRRQLYSLLEKRPLNSRSVSLIGNCFPTDESSELVRLIRESGFDLKDITLCKTYAEYQKMAESFLAISCCPAARAGGDALEKRLSQKHRYLPLSYSYREIEQNLHRLSGALGVPERDYSSAVSRAEAALRKARKVIGGCPVALDAAATPRPLSLSRLLCEHGFSVERIYADGFSPEEKADFEWLRKNRPEIRLYPVSRPEMRVLPRRTPGKTLAVGQKAAYFTGSSYFVNVVEGGGMYGFDGICRMAKKMTDAFLHEKDARSLIQMKGLGCDGCR